MENTGMSEQSYLNLLQKVLEKGNVRDDRTKTGTKSLFGEQMRFDLKQGFPLLTTKKIHTKSVVHELLWFLKGDTNVKYLQDNGVKIWNEWATAEQTARFGRKEGDLGAVYGHQWRNFGATKKPNGEYNNDGFDQISWVVNEIKRNPDSRRLIVSGWNPSESQEVALPPCHTLFQFYVQNNELSCQLYQRSCDLFLGLPFNIASYSTLVHLVAQVCNLDVGEFVWTGGDSHIYLNHQEQVKLQLGRETYTPPSIKLNQDITNIFDFTYDDIMYENYKCHSAIKADIAV